MEMIRPRRKQRVRVTSITAKNTPSHHIHKIEAGDEKVDDEMDD